MMQCRGFTSIELVMVIVVVGILSAVAAPRFFDNSFSARGFHDETLALLRYAQKAAIAQRRTVCVTFTSTGATLTIASAVPPSTNCDTNLTGLAGPNEPSGALTYTIKTDEFGVNYTTVPTDFNFNALGQPSVSQSLHVEGMTVTQNITIEAETGYVHE